MHLVRLLASQRKVQNIKHPVLDGCKTYNLSELEEMAARRIGGADPEELVLGLRSLVRNIVGRYCYHWPSTRRFKDDMISVAMEAVVTLVNRMVNNPPPRDIMYTASLHVRRAIERMLNKLQSNAAPSFTTQETLIRDGKLPVYLTTDREVEPDDKSVDNQEKLFDALEVVAKLRLDCELEAQIMDPDNWHLNDVELAAKLGVERRRVLRRRKKLLKQYQKMLGD